MVTSHYKLRHKLEEVYGVSPNDLGNSRLTGIYKRITRFLKTMPFIYIIPFSFLMALSLYLLIGPLLVKLATYLQYGF